MAINEAENRGSKCYNLEAMPEPIFVNRIIIEMLVNLAIVYFNKGTN